MAWGKFPDPVKHHLNTAYEGDVLWAKFYESIREAKKQNRVVWVPGMGPWYEILTAMDIKYVMVESWAFVLGRYQLGGRLMDVMERYGVSRETCSYIGLPFANLLEGAEKMDDVPLGGVPVPDLLIVNNFQCDDEIKITQLIQEHFNVPAITVDVPCSSIGSVSMEDLEGYIVDYYVHEIKNMVEGLEEHFKTKLDPEKLQHCIDNTNRMYEIANKVTDVRKLSPLVLNHADYMSCYQMPMLYGALGTDWGVYLYEKALVEINERVANGQGVTPNEKARLLWGYTPPHINVGIFNWMEDNFGTVVPITAGDILIGANSKFVMDKDKPYDSLARRYLGMGVNAKTGEEGLLGRKSYTLEQMVKDFKIDGVIHTSPWTCRPMVLAIQDEIESFRKLGIPSIVLDWDMVDNRHYNDYRIKTKIQALIETILKKKEESVAGAIATGSSP